MNADGRQNRDACFVQEQGYAISTAGLDALAYDCRGNPAKVGAFGVGAHSMFSICEEPMVMISGKQAHVAFVRKGDTLRSMIFNQPTSAEWTSFCLPSRDPYPLPDLVEFGQFFCAKHTFTSCLKEVQL